nr:MAG TPA: hypothetical protein [Caudoviricetes sp.]
MYRSVFNLLIFNYYRIVIYLYLIISYLSRTKGFYSINNNLSSFPYTMMDI